jgi:hypothetical protein
MIFFRLIILRVDVDFLKSKTVFIIPICTLKYNNFLFLSRQELIIYLFLKIIYFIRSKIPPSQNLRFSLINITVTKIIFLVSCALNKWISLICSVSTAWNSSSLCRRFKHDLFKDKGDDFFQIFHHIFFYLGPLSLRQ